MEQADDSFPVLPRSVYATRTVNPIRTIIQKLEIPKSTDEKKLIPLSIGDPTVFGNLRAPEVLVKAVQDAVADLANHGYKHSAGMESARRAVAARYSKSSGRALSEDDIVLASGCSGALDIAIKALCSEGDNLLVPKPGFALYETLAKSNGTEVHYYPLVPEKAWEADLEALEAQIDSRTRAILINNPSNPCGSVYSKEHLEALLGIAHKHKLPVIADEIYGNLVFKGNTFHPLASLTRTVPILEVGGIAKEFLVPGFRLGWLILHDVPASSPDAAAPRTALQEVRTGVIALSQLLVGPNTLVQAALPRILAPESGSADEAALEAFHADTLSKLEANAQFLTERLSRVKGIQVIVPQGAMYVMIGLDKSELGPGAQDLDDVQFAQRLLNEELVFLLPGSCFGLAGYLRIVFCAPQEVLGDACDRIERFCGALA